MIKSVPRKATKDSEIIKKLDELIRRVEELEKKIPPYYQPYTPQYTPYQPTWPKIGDNIYYYATWSSNTNKL